MDSGSKWVFLRDEVRDEKSLVKLEKEASVSSNWSFCNRDAGGKIVWRLMEESLLDVQNWRAATHNRDCWSS